MCLSLAATISLAYIGARSRLYTPCTLVSRNIVNYVHDCANIALWSGVRASRLIACRNV